MANIHELGLGILKLLTSQVEKDNNIQVWNDLEPHARNWLGEIFPNANVEVHPIISTGFKVVENIQKQKQQKLIEQAKLVEQKLLEEPKEEVKQNANRNGFRGYVNIR